jgi:SLOG cluster2
MSNIGRYRSARIDNQLIGLSMSYQRENLLARGLGLEHLRELLLRVARPLLRQGASIAYGGNWQKGEDNFTYELLQLIKAEQADNSLGGHDTSLTIGRLYNHSAWPHYLSITPGIEAQWINCCRIVRVTQKDAGIEGKHIVPDSEAGTGSEKVLFNSAVTLSAMRRLMMHSMSVSIPDCPPEIIPPVMARVTLGGKIDDFSGFLPGIFEEALLTLENKRPLYVLGGFGGASGVLAQAFLASGNDRPPELTIDWHQERNSNLTKLTEASKKYPIPSGVRATAPGLDALFQLVLNVRSNPGQILRTGLNDLESQELLTTSDITRAVQLVRKGLDSQFDLAPLPA